MVETRDPEKARCWNQAGSKVTRRLVSKQQATQMARSKAQQKVETRDLKQEGALFELQACLKAMKRAVPSDWATQMARSKARWMVTMRDPTKARCTNWAFAQRR